MTDQEISRNLKHGLWFGIDGHNYAILKNTLIEFTHDGSSHPEITATLHAFVDSEIVILHEVML